MTAWKDKPSHYLITTRDRTTDPRLQRHVADRMHATTREVATGHLSMIVRPDIAARFILDAARG